VSNLRFCETLGLSGLDLSSQRRCHALNDDLQVRLALRQAGTRRRRKRACVEQRAAQKAQWQRLRETEIQRAVKSSGITIDASELKHRLHLLSAQRNFTQESVVEPPYVRIKPYGKVQ
jgi:hypothetical protein